MVASAILDVVPIRLAASWVEEMRTSSFSRSDPVEDKVFRASLTSGIASSRSEVIASSKYRSNLCTLRVARNAKVAAIAENEAAIRDRTAIRVTTSPMPA